MWWPRKPQPPVTRTEPRDLGGFWAVMVVWWWGYTVRWCRDRMGVMVQEAQIKNLGLAWLASD